MIVTTIISSVISSIVFGVGGYYYGKKIERETYLDDKYEDLIKSYQEEEYSFDPRL